MYSVVKRIEFCYGHRLLDYQGKCAHPHGHNGLVEIEVTAEALDPAGMVIDFGVIADKVAAFVEQALDHKMLLRKDDPLVEVLHRLGEPTYIMEVNPTAENLARLIFDVASAKGLAVSAVRFWETPQSFAEYRSY